VRLKGELQADVAFDELFRESWARAVASARRVVGTTAEAEELAAEAFTRAYDRWPSLHRHPAPRAWILRVTINLALDSLRKRRPEDEVIDLREGNLDLTDPDKDVAIMRLALGAALRALPDKQRAAIALRYLAGCDEEETAAALGISPGTVKTHLKRGLERLRRQLGTDPEGSLAPLI
jgi:RNA polymerase sigma factor (sigma-70 family)